MFVQEELETRSLYELLHRSQHVIAPMTLVDAAPMDVLDRSRERLIRWTVKREPGRFLGGPSAANKPCLAVVEGLPSSFAIRLD